MSASGITVVGNAGAGRRDRSTVERAVGELATAAPTTLVWTSSDQEVDELVRSIDDERLVVAGGDGSIHAVVNALDRQDRLDVEIAVLPFGTGNDFAGGLGIEDTDAAVGAAIGDRTLAVDLLRADDLVAVNALHIGLGAEVAGNAERLKPRIGPAAYPLAAVATGLTHRGFTASIRLDDEPAFDDRFTMITVANGRRIGGGYPIAPDASPADTDLDVTIVRHTGVAGRARLAWALRNGGQEELDHVDIRRADRIRVATEGVGSNADGEVGEIEALDVRVDAARLRVCVPD